MRSRLLPVFFLSLLLIACEETDTSPLSEESSRPMDRKSKICDTCDVTCPDHTRCSATCKEGDCNFVCNTGAICTFACDGGGCNMTCEDRAECTFSCDGGGCTEVGVL